MPISVSEEVKNEVKKRLSNMQSTVTIYFFEPIDKCLYCKEEREILSLVSEISDKIKIRIIKGIKNEIAEKMQINMAPALVIHGKENYNIRYFGLPAGYEFGAFIEDIVDASKGEPQMDERTKELIKNVDKEVHIWIFVTPTCPYCPLAVRAAHKFAILNRLVFADMIEALEFNELTNKYHVYAVPKNIIRGVKEVIFEGAVPELYFAAAVLKSINKEIDINLEEFLKKGKVTKIH